MVCIGASEAPSGCLAPGAPRVPHPAREGGAGAIAQSQIKERPRSKFIPIKRTKRHGNERKMHIIPGECRVLSQRVPGQGNTGTSLLTARGKSGERGSHSCQRFLPAPRSDKIKMRPRCQLPSGWFERKQKQQLGGEKNWQKVKKSERMKSTKAQKWLKRKFCHKA